MNFFRRNKTPSASAAPATPITTTQLSFANGSGAGGGSNPLASIGNANTEKEEAVKRPPLTQAEQQEITNFYKHCQQYGNNGFIRREDEAMWVYIAQLLAGRDESEYMQFAGGPSLSEVINTRSSNPEFALLDEILKEHEGILSL